MNPYLDEDMVTLADHVRRFATDRIAPGFLERDKSRELERRLMREMGEMGFIAPELPQEFGGQGLGCLATGVIHEEVARADLSICDINLLASTGEGTAADLASRGAVAVFPVAGWWKEQPSMNRSADGARYALVLSIETPPDAADVWTPVANEIGVPVEVAAL